MKRPFAVFDIDGTLIRWQLFHALVDGMVKKGLIDAQQFDAVKDARMAWKRRIHADSFSRYEEVMVGLFDSLLPTIKVQEMEDVSQMIFDEYKDQTYRYTKHLITELKAKGYVLLAISGSPVQVVNKLAEYYEFDDWIAATYEHGGGSFTGSKFIPVGKKHEVLKELTRKHGLTYEGSIAVGDSSGDISMLDEVEEPIAFNPDAVLLEHARKNGWKIVVERKNVTYELESRDGTYILA